MRHLIGSGYVYKKKNVHKKHIKLWMKLINKLAVVVSDGSYKEALSCHKKIIQ